MKLKRGFKINLYMNLLLLYGSGILVWALNTFAKSDHGFGPEAPASTIWFLRSHSIVSLWFLILFGYLFRVHIEPGLKAQQKTKSGLFLTVYFGILILTVPGLFYLTDEKQKASVALVHTYLGLAILVPFLFHYLVKKVKTERRVRHGKNKNS